MLYMPPYSELKAMYSEACISQICIPAVISREAGGYILIRLKSHAPASDGYLYVRGFINLHCHWNSLAEIVLYRGSNFVVVC